MRCGSGGSLGHPGAPISCMVGMGVKMLMVDVPGVYVASHDLVESKECIR